MVSTLSTDSTMAPASREALDAARMPGAYMYGRGQPLMPRRFWTLGDFEEAHRRFAQALAAVGVRPGDLVAIRLGNPSVAWALGTAVMAMGGRVWHVAGPAPAVPDVLVTDPWTALGWPASEAPRVVVLTDAVGAMVPALRERLGEQWGRAPVIRSWYSLVEVPGPLAVECAHGRLHGRRPGDDGGVVLEAGGPAGQVGPLWVATGGQRWDTGDVARAVTCGCGHPGLALEDLERAADVIAVGPDTVSRTRLLAALFRTPGFGGAARVAVRHDRARGQDELALEVSVAAGWDAAQVAEAVAISVAAVAHRRPRVAVDRDLGAPGLQVADERTLSAAHTSGPLA